MSIGVGVSISDVESLKYKIHTAGFSENSKDREKDAKVSAGDTVSLDKERDNHGTRANNSLESTSTADHTYT